MNKSILFSLLCTCFTFQAIAQSESAPLTFKDNAFFYEAIEEYRDWLKMTKLDSVIEASDFVLSTEENLVALDLMATNQKEWISLCKSYEKDYSANLREVLFYRLLFVFQIDKKQGGIRLRTHKNDHFLDMRYMSDSLIIQESKPKAIPVLLYFPLEQLSGFGVVEGATSIEHTKGLLKRFFRSKFNTRDFPDINLRIDEYNNNHLTIVLRNMKDEVLSKSLGSYFEWLTIEAEIYKKGEQVFVKYDMMGKYSWSVFNRRIAGYSKMNEEQTSYLWDYNSKLRSAIDAFIRDKSK